ncbi:MAG: hypothetical protein ACOYOB_05735 [Myxococcota bacterium]
MRYLANFVSVVMLFAIVAPGCSESDSPGSTDAAVDDVADDSADLPDTTPPVDTAEDATAADTAADLVVEVETDDAGQDPDDGATVSATLTAWGQIEGACGGAISAELTKPMPSFLVNSYTFAKPGPFDPGPLRPGALKRYEGDNAGGSSKCSEVMSMQLLFDCEGATTLKTELEIVYTGQGGITDWMAEFDGLKIGVSVTRAYLGPSVTTYSVDKAKELLAKKLTGIQESTGLVRPEDKWQKQILHVWTLQPTWVPMLQEAWDSLDATVKADTIVLVTVEVGADSVVKDTCL